MIEFYAKWDNTTVESKILDIGNGEDVTNIMIGNTNGLDAKVVSNPSNMHDTITVNNSIIADGFKSWRLLNTDELTDIMMLVQILV
mgnify:CR=1 FL=1